LRNLADLLRGLGDDEPAALFDAAADAAPDAPADHGRSWTSVPGPVPDRTAVLALALALTRNLPRSRLEPRVIGERLNAAPKAAYGTSSNG
jgi:hypothetical protein